MTNFVQVALVLLCQAWLSVQQEKLPNECERGVKRHHPSQANVFQVFTRSNLLKQWIDYQCEKFMIFDPRRCACVERPRGVVPAVKKRDNNITPPAAFDGDQRNNNNNNNNDNDNKNDNNNNNEEYNNINSLNNTVDRGQRRRNRVWNRGEIILHKLPGSENFPQNEVGTNVNARGTTDLQSKKKENNQAPKDTVDFSEGNRERKQPSKTEVDVEEGSESDCYLHQPSAESASHFERWTDGQWVTEDCNFPFYTGLIWNQDKCRCEWGPNRTTPISMEENAIPASCLMMLQLTFDDGEIKDDGRGVWINIHNKEDASVVNDVTAVGGYSGYFRGASLSIPFFKSNVIGPIFHIGFMFKLCPGNPDTDILLVHNDCKESLYEPSLVVSYQAWKKQVIVAMTMVETEVPQLEYCTLRNTDPQKSWVTIDIRYQENYLEVSANGEVCVSSYKYTGILETNNCPLSLLGDSFCGNIDEVIITRGCTEEHAIS